MTESDLAHTISGYWAARGFRVLPVLKVTSEHGGIPWVRSDMVYGLPRGITQYSVCDVAVPIGRGKRR